jgi:hypothetical protein
MAIFGSRRNTQEVDVPVYEGYVQEDLAGLQSILSESAHESFQLRAGMYISDVMMEETVLEGAATPEVLMEAFVKDTFGKIKEMFQKLWAKVRAWFEAAKKTLQRIFLSGENFIKKFKEEINAKESKGFKFTGYNYTIEKGKSDLAGKIKVIEDTIGASVGFDITDVTGDAQQRAIGEKKESHKSDFNLQEEKEKLVKKLGHDQMTDITKDLQKSFRNGKDSEEEFTDFGGNSKDELIKIIEGNKKYLADINQAQKANDEQFKRVLDAIKRAEAKLKSSEVSKDDKGGAQAQAKAKAVAFAQHKYNMAHFALTLENQLNGVHVEAAKSAAKQAESVLKKFLAYKPAKESWTSEEDGETSTNSILESAMKFI